jgi:hypothetical protein
MKDYIDMKIIIPSDRDDYLPNYPHNWTLESNDDVDDKSVEEEIVKMAHLNETLKTKTRY